VDGHDDEEKNTSAPRGSGLATAADDDASHTNARVNGRSEVDGATLPDTDIGTASCAAALDNDALRGD